MHLHLNYRTLLSLTVIISAIFYSACVLPPGNKKQLSGTGSQPAFADRAVPPAESDTDSLISNRQDENLSAFTTLYVKDNVFVELISGNGYTPFAKDDDVLLSQQGDNLFLSGTGKITLPLNGLKSLKALLTDRAWLHFSDLIDNDFDELVLDITGGMVTSLNVKEVDTLKITAKAAIIELGYHMEPKTNLYLNLQQGSSVKLVCR